MHSNKTIEISDINSLYHAYLTNSVSKIPALTEFKGAIYRELGTHILHISMNAQNEYNTYEDYLYIHIFKNMSNCNTAVVFKTYHLITIYASGTIHESN